jgi:hypothetical protein
LSERDPIEDLLDEILAKVEDARRSVIKDDQE